MKRLFFGCKPDDRVVRECVSLLQAIAIGADNVRLVPAANLHATLVFLGGVDKAGERALLDQADGVVFPGVSVTLDRLSHWPKPRVLCLTSTQPSPAWSVWAGQLRGIAEHLGFVLDNCPYVPHVTLAKKAKHPMVVDFPPLVWQVASFSLFESVLTKNGLVYQEIKYWPASELSIIKPAPPTFLPG